MPRDHAQSDVPTDRIETIARQAARAAVRSSGEHPPVHTCDQEQRFARLEKRADNTDDSIARLEERADDTDASVDKINQALSDGRVEFAKLHKDIEALTAAVNGLKSIVAWVGGAVGVGLLGTAGTALVWVLAQMGKGGTP